MIEARSQNNLPMGVVVNRTAWLLPQNLKAVPVTLAKYQFLQCLDSSITLLAADIVEVEHCPWDFHLVPCPMMAIRFKSPSVLCPHRRLQAEIVLSFGVSEC